MRAELLDVACALSGGILDIVRFIDRQHRELKSGIKLKDRGRLKGRYRYAAITDPILHCGQFIITVHLDDRQIAVLCDLTAPVGQHRRGTNDRKVCRALVAQMHHHGDRLHGLAQAHLVA